MQACEKGWPLAAAPNDLLSRHNMNNIKRRMVSSHGMIPVLANKMGWNAPEEPCRETVELRKLVNRDEHKSESSRLLCGIKGVREGES